MTQGPQDQLIRCIVAFSQLHPDLQEAILLIAEVLSGEVSPAIPANE